MSHYSSSLRRVWALELEMFVKHARKASAAWETQDRKDLILSNPWLKNYTDTTNFEERIY